MAAYDINENMDCCANCVYQYYDRDRGIDRCAYHNHTIAGEYISCCDKILKRYEPEPWTGFQMIEGLMDETLADDEEIMIYIVLGAAQAVKMAVIDMDDCTRQRAEVIRDVAKRIFTERKNENE